MAAAASSEVSEQEKETQRTKGQRPCRVCSDFKTWAKAHSRREKKVFTTSCNNIIPKCFVYSVCIIIIIIIIIMTLSLLTPCT